ncbi:hypothetical protein X975_02010, partial [Stegodyphus mimosarum]
NQEFDIRKNFHQFSHFLTFLYTSITKFSIFPGRQPVNNPGVTNTLRF